MRTVLEGAKMDRDKRKKLEAKGWKVGNVQEFLGLSPEEMAYIEIKQSLANQLRKLREEKKITQTALAKLLESSQSRIAKMEACDPSVSIDLLIKSLLALGSTKGDLSKFVKLSS